MQRSFYYWQTVFRLTPKEAQTLQQLQVKHLYVKFFDVEWNEESGAVKPVAKINFLQNPPPGIAITPVVFITQPPLQKLQKAELDSLAKNIAALLSSISANNKLALSNEVQLDCDWTTTTKEAYFYLLQQVKRQAFFQPKIISATIRLHQLKFVSQAGVPPVNKGLLMCYNMGNLRHSQTSNSIIEEAELKKYINNLHTYPLPLDVALPVFDWWVLFEGEQYKGIVRDFAMNKESSNKNRIYFDADTTINGYTFKSGQWLRHETSDADVIKDCAAAVSKKLKTAQLSVILYHLNEEQLTKYSPHELESFYNHFR